MVHIGKGFKMHTLKLDIDNKKIDINHLNFVIDKLNINVTNVTVYETTKGFHILINIDNPEIVEPEIPFIQALLGSDLKRETLNYIRVLNNERNWNILFTLKENINNKSLSIEKFNNKLTRELTNTLIQ